MMKWLILAGMAVALLLLLARLRSRQERIKKDPKNEIEKRDGEK